MPIQYKDIFCGVYDFSRLRKAYYHIVKRENDSSAGALKYYSNLERSLCQTSEKLKAGKYRFGPYRLIKIKEPKPRTIALAPFEDKLIHFTLFETLEPIFEPQFYFHSYGCRSGKGTKPAVEKLFEWVRRRPDDFFLKCDVHQFYNSIDKTRLVGILGKTIRDQALLSCIESLAVSLKGDGVQTGNIVSPLLANIYLNELDQFLKRKLQIKFYIRYMDDFVLFTKSIEEARRIKGTISHFLKQNLMLDLSPQKVQIGKCRSGISFLGYKVTPSEIRIRGKALRKIKSNLYRARLEALSKEPAKARSTFHKALMAHKGQISLITHANALWTKLIQNDLGLM